MTFYQFIQTIRSGDFQHTMGAFYVLGLQEAATGPDCRIGIPACRAYLICLGYTVAQVQELFAEYEAGLADGA